MAGHNLKILVFKLISLKKNIGQACSCQEIHHISHITYIQMRKLCSDDNDGLGSFRLEKR